MKLSGRNIPLLRAGLAGILGGLLVGPAVALAEGMPQLDFKSPLTISQVVWGAIIFVVLYILLSRSGLPMVASVLEERAAHIAHDLEGARSAKATADADLETAHKAIAQARTEAQAAISSAVEAAKQAAAAQSEALNAKLEARLHEAEAQVADARAAAMGALRQVATDTTINVVARLTGAAPDRTQLDRAVATAMTARGVG